MASTTDRYQPATESAEIFDVQTNVPLIHQVVVAQLAAARQGTHSTKTRGEVRGGGAKPYRQKGTGRARQGSTRAPQFAGGGVVHGPTPRDYAQRTPKKMKAAALRGALSDRARYDRIHVVDSLVDGDAPSAKAGVRRARRADRAPQPARRARAWDEVAFKRVRNLQDVHVLVADQLNTYDVLCADDMVFTQAALDAFVAGPGRPTRPARRTRSEHPHQGPARHPHRAGRLREVLRAARRGQVHLHRRPPVRTRRRSRSPSSRSSTSRSTRSTP